MYKITLDLLDIGHWACMIFNMFNNYFFPIKSMY